MKKGILVVFLILCSFHNMYGKSKEFINLNLTYYDYYIYTLVSLTEADLSFIEPKCYQITENDEKRILKCLKYKRHVKVVNHLDSEFDLSFLDEETSSDKNKVVKKKKDIEKKFEKIGDEDMNVRFIAVFDGHKLVFGQFGNYIKFDDEYYSISNSQYIRLINMFLKLVNEGSF